jgi:hypothetical protein
MKLSSCPDCGGGGGSLSQQLLTFCHQQTPNPIYPTQFRSKFAPKYVPTPDTTK